MKGKEYARKDSKLYLKKEKLYLDGNPKFWEIRQEDLKKFTPKELAENKGLAMKIMLPKVEDFLRSNRKREIWRERAWNSGTI